MHHLKPLISSKNYYNLVLYISIITNILKKFKFILQILIKLNTIKIVLHYNTVVVSARTNKISNTFIKEKCYYQVEVTMLHNISANTYVSVSKALKKSI